MSPYLPTPSAILPLPDHLLLDTCGGRVRVEWDPQAPVTPLGQLVFFTQFLETSGRFDLWVKDRPGWLLNVGFTDPSREPVPDTDMAKLVFQDCDNRIGNNVDEDRGWLTSLGKRRVGLPAGFTRAVARDDCPSPRALVGVSCRCRCFALPLSTWVHRDATSGLAIMWMRTGAGSPALERGVQGSRRVCTRAVARSGSFPPIKAGGGGLQ